MGESSVNKTLEIKFSFKGGMRCLCYKVSVRESFSTANMLRCWDTMGLISLRMSIDEKFVPNQVREGKSLGVCYKACQKCLIGTTTDGQCWGRCVHQKRASVTFIHCSAPPDHRPSSGSDSLASTFVKALTSFRKGNKHSFGVQQN